MFKVVQMFKYVQICTIKNKNNKWGSLNKQGRWKKATFADIANWLKIRNFAKQVFNISFDIENPQSCSEYIRQEYNFHLKCTLDWAAL